MLLVQVGRQFGELDGLRRALRRCDCRGLARLGLGGGLLGLGGGLLGLGGGLLGLGGLRGGLLRGGRPAGDRRRRRGRGAQRVLSARGGFLLAELAVRAVQQRPEDQRGQCESGDEHQHEQFHVVLRSVLSGRSGLRGRTVGARVLTVDRDEERLHVLALRRQLER
ncbi:hypothetical protein F1721_27750 [Saccharopolyspora hirsuta]|uniref:Uncharacterized protein n=1 Tax=Saccharopolyspora hirsuta TaxID=1837 RepID=A0A5M7BH84_SACHI|nr:hypothetical protein F1721_27750 [Saccharopolyspora hirsuta]